MTRGEGEESTVETMSAEEGVQRVEMSGEVRLKGRTREKGVVVVSRGERAMWETTVEVRKVGGRSGVEMVSRERSVLTVETEEGGGPWEGGVKTEPQVWSEETVPMEIGGKEGDVVLSTVETGTDRCGR